MAQSGAGGGCHGVAALVSRSSKSPPQRLGDTVGGHGLALGPCGLGVGRRGSQRERLQSLPVPDCVSSVLHEVEMRRVGRLEGAMRAGARVVLLPILGGAAAASLLELVFRCAHIASSFPTSKQNARDVILRFDTAGPTTGVRSHGPLAKNRIRWRVNNEGWNCPHDYLRRTSARPRIALLGDSYIEALYVDIDDHIESLLERMFDGEADVYAFGRSNWYLAQYVALSRYVEERFSPDVYAIFLTADDVWWSLREKGLKSPYLFQISRLDDRFVELPPPTILKRRRLRLLLRRSALVCYVSNNLGVRWLLRRRAERFSMMASGMEAADGQRRQPHGDEARLLRDATSFMLRSLVESHPGRSFVFVDTSDCASVYEGRSASKRDPEREAVRAECQRYDNCYYFDLWPVFVADYARNHQRFEVSRFGHWNGHANRVIARGLAAFLTTQGAGGGPLTRAADDSSPDPAACEVACPRNGVSRGPA